MLNGNDLRENEWLKKEAEWAEWTWAEWTSLGAAFKMLSTIRESM